MRMKLFFGFLCIIALICCNASAIDFTDWKQITVDENLVNSSSDTIFTVMLPPGYVESTMDAPFGTLTSFVNETNPNLVITVGVIDNPIGQQLNDKNSKNYLDNFMLGANITPEPGVEPQYLESGGIVDYGTFENMVAGVFITSTDEKVIITSGFYPTKDDASAGVETLAMVAGTVQIETSK
jgi:hypothetical protein